MPSSLVVFWLAMTGSWALSALFCAATFCFRPQSGGVRGTPHRIYPISVSYLTWILGPLAGGFLGLGLLGWGAMFAGIFVGAVLSFLATLFMASIPETLGTG